MPHFVAIKLFETIKLFFLIKTFFFIAAAILVVLVFIHFAHRTGAFSPILSMLLVLNSNQYNGKQQPHIWRIRNIEKLYIYIYPIQRNEV